MEQQLSLGIAGDKPPIGTTVAFRLTRDEWAPAIVESYGATETIHGPKPYLMLRYHPTLAASAYLDEEGTSWQRLPEAGHPEVHHG